MFLSQGGHILVYSSFTLIFLCAVSSNIKGIIHHDKSNCPFKLV